jgi:hypothetical protein
MIVTSIQLKSSSRRDIAVLQKESPSFRVERMSTFASFVQVVDPSDQLRRFHTLDL